MGSADLICFQLIVYLSSIERQCYTDAQRKLTDAYGAYGYMADAHGWIQMHANAYEYATDAYIAHISTSIQ